MKHAKMLLFILLATAAHPLAAQNIASARLQWDINKITDAQTGISNDDIQKIITADNDSILWLDATGNVKYNFQVTQVDGAWPDVQKPGSVAYAVQAGQERGRVEVWLKDGRRMIRITVFTRTPDVPPQVVELTVDNIQTL